ncbi:hypothetical protein MHI48_04960 [Paenibacillus sp. FSL H7-0942]|nr:MULTISPECIES: hypothetical protein [Paenibacillus]APO44048.1 hypothetical protein BS614_08530 [Paenibacillus xylanexedens]KLU52930.1 hypothetical protein EL84_11095 [Paenibacillus sp. VT-400]OME99188.1 hypothetical protein BK129_28210 [Paenibacillus amylolyticus]
MYKLMNVGDIFESSEHGTILVGINPDLDNLSHDQIKKRINNYIFVRTPDNKEFSIEVVSIQISSSLMNKKSIGICVGKSISQSEIPINSVVYTQNS